jgi:predicted double-glycine peptidase
LTSGDGGQGILVSGSFHSTGKVARFFQNWDSLKPAIAWNIAGYPFKKSRFWKNRATEKPGYRKKRATEETS